MSKQYDRIGAESSTPRADEFANLFAPAIVDIFAGCGGWSIGCEQALTAAGINRGIDLMINHWDVAVGVHQANHPLTEHLRANILEVDPDKVLIGRKIAYLHASPDCTDHSRAKGGVPRRKEIRALADVVIVWADKRRPDVITLENVPEFKEWGPLDRHGKPIKSRRGEEFKRWKSELEALGYVVEHRELKACDYGAPTTRKRLFVIARCDGKPIIWPEITYGPASRTGGKSESESERKRRVGQEVRESGQTNRRRSDEGSNILRHRHSDSSRIGVDIAGHSQSGRVGIAQDLKPFHTAAECIDWSIPMLSIFATPEEAREFSKLHGVGVPRRPLQTKTLQRIARGLVKFVIESKRPFLVNIQNYGWDNDGTASVDRPLGTITANPKGGAYAAVDAKLAPYTVPNLGEAPGQSPRCGSVEEPLNTVTSKGNGARLVAATLQTLNHSGPEHRGQSPADPLHTVTSTRDARAMVAALITKHYGGVTGHVIEKPIGTVTGADHHALTCAYLSQMRGTNDGTRQGDLAHPLATITGEGNHAGLIAAFLEQYGAKHESNRSSSRDDLARNNRSAPGRDGLESKEIESVGSVRDINPETVQKRDEGGVYLNPAGLEGEAVPPMGSSIGMDSDKRKYSKGNGNKSHRRDKNQQSSEQSGTGNGSAEQGSRTADRSDAATRSTSTEAEAEGNGIAENGEELQPDCKDTRDIINHGISSSQRSVTAGWLSTYYGNSKDGHRVDDPAPTVVGKDRIQLVTVVIDNQTYVITDIAMRMLRPRELARAQGFDDSYIIERQADGTPVSKADQVKLIGNSVCPQVARSIVKANVVDQGVLDEVRAGCEMGVLQ